MQDKNQLSVVSSQFSVKNVNTKMDSRGYGNDGAIISLILIFNLNIC